jgi:hypothetical protein
MRDSAQGDRSMAGAANGKVGPELRRRIDFLERVIRVIDLE